MEPKYKVGQLVWSYVRKNHGIFIEQSTIEFIVESDIKAPSYKMKEGASFWREENEIFDDVEVVGEREMLGALNKKIMEGIRLQEERDAFWESVIDNRKLSDGIYDVTGIRYLELDEECRVEDVDKVKAFIIEHPEYVVANAYNTFLIFILGRRPEEITAYSGSGFNYGSTNIIHNCPKSVLILAEDD